MSPQEVLGDGQGPSGVPQRAIIVPGAKFGGGDRVYDLVAEDGEHIASHVCSAPAFAPYDLWSHRTERQEAFAHKRITEVVFLDQSGIDLSELRARNKAWAEGQEQP